MQDIYKHIKNNLFYYIIYLFFIIEIVINLQSKNIAGDESFSYNIVHHSFINIINLTSQDVHPFLYYFIAKIFSYNIKSIYIKIYILRMVSALPYVIMLLIGNYYIKKEFSQITSLIFMFCIISMPSFSENIYIIRMYGWATLFTIIVYLLFRYSYNNNNNNKIFMLISLFSILASYTHYYALMTIFILYVLFLILFIMEKKKLKYIILSIFINILLYLPWLKILLNQTKTSYKSFWSDKMTLKHFLAVFFGNISPIYHLSVSYIFPMLLLSILCILLFRENITMSIIGIITPFLLIITGSVLSIIVHHTIIFTRYIMPSMGIFWLELSIIIMNIKQDNKLLKHILILLILMIGILSYVNTNANIINQIEDFNQTLKIYNKMPKDSAFIYDDISTMFGKSDYLKNNYMINNNNNIVYQKTLNNFKIINRISLPKKYKNIYYVKSNNTNDNALINKFNNKYRTNNKNLIHLPREDFNSNMYKIK